MAPARWCPNTPGVHHPGTGQPDPGPRPRSCRAWARIARKCDARLLIVPRLRQFPAPAPRPRWEAPRYATAFNEGPEPPASWTPNPDCLPYSRSPSFWKTPTGRRLTPSGHWTRSPQHVFPPRNAGLRVVAERPPCSGCSTSPTADRHHLLLDAKYTYNLWPGAVTAPSVSRGTFPQPRDGSDLDLDAADRVPRTSPRYTSAPARGERGGGRGA